MDRVKGHKEGLVHVSNLRDQRVIKALDVVKKNQNVKVKVLSIVGNKVSLSMKEVDQATGKDLKPNRQKALDQVSRF
jgi:ATP-dependent RNA helicase DHX8/PRP22